MIKNILIIIFLCFEYYLFSQDPLIVEYLRNEPDLDGKLSESVWNSVNSYSMIMLNPVSGNPASQKTNFKIGYTDKYLYIAAYMYDNELGMIRAASKKRDDMSLSNDWFAEIQIPLSSLRYKITDGKVIICSLLPCQHQAIYSTTVCPVTLSGIYGSGLIQKRVMISILFITTT